MPTYTPIPTEHRGEENLARQLDAMPDPKWHRWFSVNYLPSVRDIDLLILHEQVGLFAIEVKAVGIEQIIRFGFGECHIRGRLPDKSPQMQALDAATDLRNYLAGKVQLPFVVPTVCWPLISRRRWNATMSDARVCGEFADRMLFNEDLSGSGSILVERLRYVYEHAPVRSSARYAFSFSRRLVDDLRSELRVEARPDPTPSDLAKLQTIQRAVESETDQHAPPGAGKHLVYTGLPGTGKTFRLLRIAYRHALAGDRVLFACYNKVLATDIRRLISIPQLLRDAPGSIEVRDVFHIIRGYAEALQLDVESSEGADDWGELVAAEMKQRESGGIFDTVLIDEGQDMRQWHFELLEHLGRDGATFAVAFGRGQELYGESAPWFEAFRGKSREHRLLRNFRNTRPVFQLAQTVFESGYDLNAIEKTADRFRRAGRAEQLPLCQYE